MSFDCKIVFEGKNKSKFYVAGQIVSGIVLFVIRKEKIFKKIVLQLKGIGKYCLKSRIKDPRTNERKTQNDGEIFENEEVCLFPCTGGKKYSPGEYAIPFSFVLPMNIPPSFAFVGNYMLSQITCRIKHTIHVKFSQVGKVIDTTKTVKEEIYIVSGVKPRVSPLPLIYGERKEVLKMQNFSKNVVSIKVFIEKSILLPGEKIKLSYEVINDTHINIITVRARLLEVYSFHVLIEKQPSINVYRKTSDLVIRSPRVMRFSSYKDSLEFDLPKTGSSVDFTKLVRRDFYVCFTLVLPCMRRNLFLKVPVLIDVTQDKTVTNKSNDLFITNFIQVIKDYDKRFKGK